MESLRHGDQSLGPGTLPIPIKLMRFVGVASTDGGKFSGSTGGLNEQPSSNARRRPRLAQAPAVRMAAGSCAKSSALQIAVEDRTVAWATDDAGQVNPVIPDLPGQQTLR